jgi:hypothetical protein
MHIQKKGANESKKAGRLAGRKGDNVAQASSFAGART